MRRTQRARAAQVRAPVRFGQAASRQPMGAVGVGGGMATAVPQVPVAGSGGKLVYEENQVVTVLRLCLGMDTGMQVRYSYRYVIKKVRYTGTSCRTGIPEILIE